MTTIRTQLDKMCDLHHNAFVTRLSFLLMFIWVSLAHLPDKVFKNVRHMPIPFGRCLVEGQTPLDSEFLHGLARYLALGGLITVVECEKPWESAEGSSSELTKSIFVPTTMMGMSCCTVDQFRYARHQIHERGLPVLRP